MQFVQFYCQCCLVVFLACGFLEKMLLCFYGRTSMKPLEFPGFVVSVIFTAMSVATYVGAGAFSQIFK